MDDLNFIYIDEDKSLEIVKEKSKVCSPKQKKVIEELLAQIPINRRWETLHILTFCSQRTFIKTLKNEIQYYSQKIKNETGKRNLAKRTIKMRNYI